MKTGSDKASRYESLCFVSQSEYSVLYQLTRRINSPGDELGYSREFEILRPELDMLPLHLKFLMHPGSQTCVNMAQPRANVLSTFSGDGHSSGCGSESYMLVIEIIVEVAQVLMTQTHAVCDDICFVSFQHILY